MIKKLLILFTIGFAFFFGLVVGHEYSPQQKCIDSLNFFMDKFNETDTELSICRAVNLKVLNKFYAYKDGVLQLKEGLDVWEYWYEELRDTEKETFDSELDPEPKKNINI